MYENFAMNAHELRHVSSVRINSAWLGSLTLPETKKILAGSYNKHTCREVSPGLDTPRMAGSFILHTSSHARYVQSQTHWTCKYVWFLSSIVTSHLQIESWVVSNHSKVESRVESCQFLIDSSRVKSSQVSGYTRVKWSHLFKSSRVNS
jgi:hypothetical protein